MCFELGEYVQVDGLRSWERIGKRRQDKFDVSQSMGVFLKNQQRASTLVHKAGYPVRPKLNIFLDALQYAHLKHIQ